MVTRRSPDSEAAASRIRWRLASPSARTGSAAPRAGSAMGQVSHLGVSAAAAWAKRAVGDEGGASGMAQITESQPRDGARSDASVAELVKQLSEQTTRLVRDEVELAKAELAQKGKSAGLGAGMFGGAAVFRPYPPGGLAGAPLPAVDTPGP